MSVLSVKNLSSFSAKKHTWRLQNITFQVQAGNIVGLIGPNGCGKTTLLRCLAGLQSTPKNCVTLQDIPLEQLSSRQQACKRAYVPQIIPACLPHRVDELLALATAHRHFFYTEAQSTSSYFKHAEQILKNLGYQGSILTPYNTLSLGQRQQVFLAQAILQETPLLLLDEPTSALDLAHQKNLWYTLRHMAKQGCSVLISLHDLSFAALICQQLLLMNHGRIANMGGVDEVLSPKNLESVYQTKFGQIMHPSEHKPLTYLV